MYVKKKVCEPDLLTITVEYLIIFCKFALVIDYKLNIRLKHEEIDDGCHVDGSFEHCIMLKGFV